MVVARPLPAAGLEPLRERFDVVRRRAAASTAPSFAARRAPAPPRSSPIPTVPVDAELLDAAGPQLRVVANFAVGYDNIDLEACRERGVIVTNTPDVLTNATAELTLALMLAAARRPRERRSGCVRAGRWTGLGAGAAARPRARRRTIGIVGLGRIGSRVAELLQGFGLELLYSLAHAARRSSSRGSASSAGARRAARARPTSSPCTCRSTPDTRHLIDRAAARALQARLDPRQHGARRPRRHRTRLIAALRSGRLAAAGARRLRERARGARRAARARERRARPAHRLGHRHAPERDGAARRGERDRGARGPADPSRRSVDACNFARMPKLAETVETSSKKLLRFAKKRTRWSSRNLSRRCRTMPPDGNAERSRSRTQGKAQGRQAPLRGLLLPPEHALRARPRGGCPTFRPAHPDGLRPPQQLSFVFRQEPRARRRSSL